MEAATVEPQQRSSRDRRLGWLAMLVLVLVAAVVAVFIVTGDDEPAAAAQISQVKASCADWMSSEPGAAESDDQWCTDMFDWMDGQGSMMGSRMGSMMWQGPEELGRTCRSWMSEDRAESGPAAQQQCDDMVAWMDAHMSSDAGHWMMRQN